MFKAKEFCGGEGGIRTLDTLPYTRFPGVRLRPLGHLTIGARSIPQYERLASLEQGEIYLATRLATY